jgi:hypothetical protein
MHPWETPPICGGSRFDKKAPGVFLSGADSGSFYFGLAAD